MSKDLDIRFPPEVHQMIQEVADSKSAISWLASKGWLVVRLEDDDEDEIAICWTLSHIKVPKREEVKDV
jgi:hypothetical protein